MDISNLAKVHIEKNYATVGITEYLESTFLLMEAYLPRFFTGLLHFYRRSKNDNSELSRTETDDKTEERIGSLRSHQNHHHSRILLQENKIIALDLDIYEFAMQRFQKQLLSLIAK